MTTLKRGASLKAIDAGQEARRRAEVIGRAVRVCTYDPTQGKEEYTSRPTVLLLSKRKILTRPIASSHRKWYLTTVDQSAERGAGSRSEPCQAGASGGAYLEILPDTRVTHGDPLVNGRQLLEHARPVQRSLLPSRHDREAGPLLRLGCESVVPVRKTTDCTSASTASGPSRGPDSSSPANTANGSGTRVSEPIGFTLACWAKSGSILKSQACTRSCFKCAKTVLSSTSSC